MKKTNLPGFITASNLGVYTSFPNPGYNQARVSPAACNACEDSACENEEIKACLAKGCKDWKIVNCAVVCGTCPVPPPTPFWQTDWYRFLVHVGIAPGALLDDPPLDTHGTWPGGGEPIPFQPAGR